MPTKDNHTKLESIMTPLQIQDIKFFKAEVQEGLDFIHKLNNDPKSSISKSMADDPFEVGDYILPFMDIHFAGYHLRSKKPVPVNDSHNYSFGETKNKPIPIDKPAGFYLGVTLGYQSSFFIDYADDAFLTTATTKEHGKGISGWTEACEMYFVQNSTLSTKEFIRIHKRFCGTPLGALNPFDGSLTKSICLQGQSIIYYYFMIMAKATTQIRKNGYPS